MDSLILAALHRTERTLNNVEKTLNSIDETLKNIRDTENALIERMLPDNPFFNILHTQADNELDSDNDEPDDENDDDSEFGDDIEITDDSETANDSELDGEPIKPLRPNEKITVEARLMYKLLNALSRSGFILTAINGYNTRDEWDSIRERISGGCPKHSHSQHKHRNRRRNGRRSHEQH